MSDQQRESSSTPSSVAGSIDPFGTTTSGRATTTERRTTTTTTTKRTIKSSDDFMPMATDVQQVRSESRTGSISSTSAPLISSANQHQSHSSSTTTSTTTNDAAARNMADSGIRQPLSSAGGQTSKNWSSSTQTQTTTTTTAGGADSSLQSPIIQDTEDGHRVLKLRFDVSQYEPDEIVVKTIDNRLTVQAKHEERSENRSVYREYNREFHLPDGTDIEQIKSSLSKDGVLTIDCPLPQLQLHGASRRIPIERV